MKIKLPILALILLFSAVSNGVDFNRDVRPILSDKCFACHGFDEKERKADLRLDTREGAFQDLGGYAAIVPGDLEKSEVWYRITTDDKEELMPPPKFHKPLSAKEKAIIQEWIKEGAEYRTHWSYAPLEAKDFPEGNFIDTFIEKDLIHAGLNLSSRADNTTLVRRLYFDLLGLPPTPKQVDAFVKNEATDAYGKLVDQLMANPAFGERMAVYWLDLVRFADTIGYHSDNLMEVSAYRDYVISSFNKNLPYDQFTIEQLAGDLLPEATIEQRIASGYNRLLQSTEEGGAQAEEYKVIHAADRVRNVSGVWLGSTIGCAQCHDHKYDPFTSRDFYTLAAFFADVKEKAIGKRQSNLKVPTGREKEKIATLEGQLTDTSIESILSKDKSLAQKVATGQSAWEEQSRTILSGESPDVWKVYRPLEMKSTGGQKLAVLGDDSILTSGPNPAKDNYILSLEGSGKVSALRLEALMDNSFPTKRLSRANGNFILSGIKISTDKETVKIASAKADYEQQSWPIAASLDGKHQTGWAVDGHTDKAANRVAMFLFETPVDFGEKGQLTIELQHQAGHAGHNIGRLRLSLTDSINPVIKGKPSLPNSVILALKKSSGERNEAERTVIRNHFLSISPLFSEARKNQDRIKNEIAVANKGIRTMLVSEALPKPRITRLLNRGDWLDKDGEIVQPALPAFLPRENELPDNRRGNRLDLAKWIMEPGNPLTARTFANRMWMLFFGNGISRNVDDLGGQGEPPTHPELLDHLAVSFRDSGWDVKALVRQILLSNAYQQTSTATTEQLEKDPTNMLWGRQGRWRLEAEFVRDTALQLSELLVHQQGGRSVKPYQPAGYWQHLNFPKRKWIAGNNEDLYRRGLYTFRCRSFPHPAMVSFDAPSREECTSQRSRSNIPQQALVLLNNPEYVEAARKFGDRIANFEGSMQEKIIFGWKEATSRIPTGEEVEVIQSLFNSQHEKYTKAEPAAKEYLSVGESPRDDSITLATAAAWTQVARAMINAYETTCRN